MGEDDFQLAPGFHDLIASFMRGDGTNEILTRAGDGLIARWNSITIQLDDSDKHGHITVKVTLLYNARPVACVTRSVMPVDLLQLHGIIGTVPITVSHP